MVNRPSSAAETLVWNGVPVLLLTVTAWAADVREAVGQVMGKKDGPVPMEKHMRSPLEQQIFDLADEEFQVREKAFVGLLKKQDDPVTLRALKAEAMRVPGEPGFDLHRKKCCHEIHKGARQKLLEKYHVDCPPGLRFAFMPADMKLPPGLGRYGPAGDLFNFHKDAAASFLFTLGSPTGTVLMGWDQERQMQKYHDLYEELAVDDVIMTARTPQQLHDALGMYSNQMRRYFSAVTKRQEKEDREREANERGMQP